MLLTVPIALHVRHLRKTEARLAETIAAIRAAGHPVSAAEATELYRTHRAAFSGGVRLPKLDEETSRDVSDACSWADFDFEYRDDVSPANRALSDRNREAFAEALLRYADLVDLMLAGGASGFAPPDFEIHTSFRYDLPQVSAARAGAKLMRLEALLAADQGDGPRAMAAVRAIMALGEALSEDPVPLSHYIRRRIHEDVLTIWPHVLRAGVLNDADLARAAEWFDDSGHGEALRRALVMTRVIGIEAYRDPAPILERLARHADYVFDPWGPARLRATIQRGRLTGAYVEDQLRFLRAVDELIAATQRPFRGMIPVLTAIYREVQPIHPEFYRRPYSLFLHQLSLWQEAVPLLETPRLRALTAATVIERHRQAHGRLPASVAELDPEHRAAYPADPYDNQPMRYCPTDTGFLVYSVGPNLTDNGGRDRTASNGYDGDVLLDVWYTVPPPPPTEQTRRGGGLGGLGLRRAP